jgi:hypothetical protein
MSPAGIDPQELTMGHRTHDRGAAQPSIPAGTGRRWWKPALLVVGVVLAVLELRGHLPGPAATWAVLREVEPAWLLAALALQILSMAMFAEQQRRLLSAFGVSIPAATTLAVSYARSAMSTALPGGSAVSAGYAFQRYRAHGASQPVAAAVMLLSGVASLAGILLLYAGAALYWTSVPGPALAVLAAVAVVAVLAWRLRRTTVPTGGAAHPGRLRRTVRETATLATMVPAGRWLAVVALAVLNWLTDLLTLLITVHATGLTVSTRTVATAYLVAQVARQIPVTPGGIGVIEASLVLALTTAGAAAAPAAAAVLAYRLLSCWLILPIGLACWTAMRTDAPAVPAEASMVPA